MERKREKKKKLISTPWWRAGNAEVDIGQLLLWLQMAMVVPTFLVLVGHGCLPSQQAAAAAAALS